MAPLLPRSLRARLLAAFLLPALGLFGVAGAAGYILSQDALESELGHSLSAIAAATASQLNGPRLLTIEPGDDSAQTRTWRNTLRTLSEIRAATGARRIVAFDRQGRVRVDDGGGLPTGTEMPELARDRLELSRVLEHGQRAESQVLFRGTDGRLYQTGYAPILSDSQVVGAVAVEGSAAFYRPLRTLSAVYGVLVLSTLLVLGGVAVLVARGLTRPLRRLMAAALRIGEGDLTTPVRPEGSLEIGTLARELEQMREALESRDRQLKMMLAGVAHEVRNPIGGIELFAGVLAEELPPADVPGAPPNAAELQAHVARIRSEIDYLKRIVEDFLTFARDQKLSLAPLSAASLVESAASLLRADAEAKEVELSVVVEPGQVEADPSLLTAAVVNLVKNAVQAAPPGSAVRIRGAASSGRYVVEVADAGAGIAAEAQSRIFEPFFTTREQGTGLGLPLARKIVQAHGGSVEAESRPGATLFRVTLPLTGADTGEEPALLG